MFNIPIKLYREKKKTNNQGNYLHSICKEALAIRFGLIVALLKYYFDQEDDGEYIQEKTDYAQSLLDNVDTIMK